VKAQAKDLMALWKLAAFFFLEYAGELHIIALR
jgi:hypothetical protein